MCETVRWRSGRPRTTTTTVTIINAMQEQCYRPALKIKEIAVPWKKSLDAAEAEKSTGTPVEAAVISSPQTAPHKMMTTPRACLCSPTKHAGSFRCRIHRGQDHSGSVGFGLNEMAKKTNM